MECHLPSTSNLSYPTERNGKFNKQSDLIKWQHENILSKSVIITRNEEDSHVNILNISREYVDAECGHEAEVDDAGEKYYEKDGAQIP